MACGFAASKHSTTITRQIGDHSFEARDVDKAVRAAAGYVFHNKRYHLCNFVMDRNNILP